MEKYCEVHVDFGSQTISQTDFESFCKVVAKYQGIVFEGFDCGRLYSDMLANKYRFTKVGNIAIFYNSVDSRWKIYREQLFIKIPLEKSEGVITRLIDSLELLPSSARVSGGYELDFDGNCSLTVVRALNLIPALEFGTCDEEALRRLPGISLIKRLRNGSVLLYLVPAKSSAPLLTHTENAQRVQKYLDTCRRPTS